MTVLPCLHLFFLSLLNARWLIEQTADKSFIGFSSIRRRVDQSQNECKQSPTQSHPHPSSSKKKYIKEIVSSYYIARSGDKKKRSPPDERTLFSICRLTILFSNRLISDEIDGTVIIYYLLSVCIKMVNNLIYKFIGINLLILFGIGWLEVGMNGCGGEWEHVANQFVGHWIIYWLKLGILSGSIIYYINFILFLQHFPKLSRTIQIAPLRGGHKFNFSLLFVGNGRFWLCKYGGCANKLVLVFEWTEEWSFCCLKNKSCVFHQKMNPSISLHFTHSSAIRSTHIKIWHSEIIKTYITDRNRS